MLQILTSFQSLLLCNFCPSPWDQVSAVLFNLRVRSAGQCRGKGSFLGLSTFSLVFLYGQCPARFFSFLVYETPALRMCRNSLCLFPSSLSPHCTLFIMFQGIKYTGIILHLGADSARDRALPCEQPQTLLMSVGI